MNTTFNFYVFQRCSHDHPTLSISTLQCSLSMGAGGLLVWVSALHAEGLIPMLAFFLKGYLLCRSRFMLCKFNCNTLSWNSVPSFIFNTVSLWIKQSIPSGFTCSCWGCIVPFSTQSYPRGDQRAKLHWLTGRIWPAVLCIQPLIDVFQIDKNFLTY